MVTLRMVPLLLLLGATTADACQCVGASVEKVLASSPLVFGGRVVAARVVGYVVEIDISGFVEIKGEGVEISRVTTKSSDGSCGFPVTVPAEYVFFANGDGEISLCGATRRLADPELGSIAQKVVEKWAKGDRRAMVDLAPASRTPG